MTPFWSDGEPVTVRSDRFGTPLAITWQGRSHAVAGIARRWRVDYGWWRERTWREYFKLHTKSGLLLILYRDLLSGAWCLQRLYD